jgi:molecular chaperone HtpG
MLAEHTRPKNGDPKDTETVTEDETLNSMIPLWKKAKSEIKENEYNEFYKSKFHDFEDPLLTIHFSGEGVVSYDAVLYIPKNPPYDFYAKEYQRGCSFIQTACSSWKNARTFCRITSVS